MAGDGVIVDLGESGARSGDRLTRKSRLSMTLSQVLEDPSALPYFLQFLERREVQHLAKFWLDAESFRVFALATVKNLPQTSPSASDETLSGQPSAVSTDAPGSSVDCDENGITPADYRSISASGASPGSIDQWMTLTGDTPTGSAGPGLTSGLYQMTCKDAVDIYSKYISQDATHSIGATKAVRNSVIERICNTEGKIDPYSFQPAQDFVFRILQDRFFQEFLSSVYHCKHVIDVLTSGKVYLSDIVHNDTAQFYFHEFMDQLGMGYLFEFCLAAEHFRKQAQKCSVPEAQQDAITIYDRYFSLQAIHPLGFGDDVRMRVEQRICNEDGSTSLSCFDEPLRSCWQMLERSHLPNFLKSNLYMTYITDLIGKVERNVELPPKSGRTPRRTASYAASEMSSGGMSVDSSQSCPPTSGGASSRRRWTLKNSLASARQNQVKKLPPDNLNIDIGASGSTDLLWKRTDSGPGLLTGRIDGMGSFVRSSDDDLPQSSKPGKRLRTALTKMVQRKSDSLEKEIAEKVAQLIIQDIESMTTSAS